MSRNNSGGWAETVKTVVYAILIAVVVRTVAFEPFNIPSARWCRRC
jgi:signal peptidase I